MKLQEQMFGLIDDWYASKSVKKDFLGDKKITQAKFDYWLKKYHASKLDSAEPSSIMTDNNFKELILPAVKMAELETSPSIKILELRTASGLQIEVFEKC
jgi:predicted phosphohydrolase